MSWFKCRACIEPIDCTTPERGFKCTACQALGFFKRADLFEKSPEGSITEDAALRFWLPIKGGFWRCATCRMLACHKTCPSEEREDESVKKNFCYLCNTAYDSKHRYQNHMNYMHYTRVQCKVCKKSLTRLAMVRHEKSHDATLKALQKEKTTKECPVCKATFANTYSLNRHNTRYHSS